MYKLQISCMVVVLFIAAVYFTAKRKRSYSHILFSVSLCTTVFNLLFDMITVYTVNHLDTVSVWVNRACHILFLGSMIMELAVCCLYSTTLIYDDAAARKKNRILSAPVLVAWLGLALLPLNYVQTPQGNYSWGPAVYTVHAITAFYMVYIVVSLLRHYREIDRKKRLIVMLAFGVQTIVMICQSIRPTLLVTSTAFMLINLAFFLTVESPDVLLAERLREEKARADEANQAKSQFLSNMSHEIRTPMNAIVGLTEVLLRSKHSDEEERYLENIKRSGDALLSLINDLLDFSKIESGKFTITEEDYEPLAMKEDLEVMFQNRIGDKPIEMRCEIDPDLPRVLCGDGVRIRQIIINLVNNAIKFTEHGFVKLSLQKGRTGQGETELCVSVQDSGQGIREEDMEKLFDAFTQVDLKKNHAKEGTGLGLAICKQLVELMGGTLHVRSTYGEGSEFSFSLWQKAVSGETIGDAKSGKDKKKHLVTEFDFTAPDAKVLLVDDNEINREVAVALLAPLCMQIDMAVNGQEALEKVQRKQYDVILMDHYMPVMDGVEACRRIRALPDSCYSRLPIIALTADATAGEREVFLAAGMNDVVSKPIRLQELVGKLQYYVNFDRLGNADTGGETNGDVGSE